MAQNFRDVFGGEIDLGLLQSLLNSSAAQLLISQARFIRRISVVSNAIQTMDNETAYLIIELHSTFDV